MTSYNPRGSNLILVILGLFIGALCAPISHLFNQPITAQSSGGNMTIDNLVFLVMLIITLAALVVLVLNNFRLANLIPVPLVRDLIKAAVDTALASAERYAITTETTADDELIRLIREEVGKLFAVEAQAAKARMQSEVAKQVQVVQKVYEPTMHVESDEAAG